jgi:hypothetical protein
VRQAIEAAIPTDACPSRSQFIYVSVGVAFIEIVARDHRDYVAGQSQSDLVAFGMRLRESAVGSVGVGGLAAAGDGASTAAGVG